MKIFTLLVVSFAPFFFSFPSFASADFDSMPRRTVGNVLSYLDEDDQIKFRLISKQSNSDAKAAKVFLEHLENEYAVHATDFLQIADDQIVIFGSRKPWNEEIKSKISGTLLLDKARLASKEAGTDFRPTSHWSLGELVRPLKKVTWENKKYAFVTPLKRLVNQIYNINRIDVGVLGDVRLAPKEFVLVAPIEMKNKLWMYPVTQISYYKKDQSLREAVHSVILKKGGVTVSGIIPKIPVNPRTEVHSYLREGTDYNSRSFFKPLLDKYPHIIFGNPLNTRLENINLNDHLWTPTGQALKDVVYPEEFIDFANQVAKWQLDQATRVILDSPFPERAKADYMKQRDRVYSSMEWKNSSLPTTYTAEDDAEVLQLNQELQKFELPRFSNFIQKHFSQGTDIYRFFINVRNYSRGFMRDLAYLPTAEALSFVKNSTLDVRTKNAIVAYVYYSKFSDISKQISVMNALGLMDNSTLLSNSVQTTPVRSLSVLGGQQLTALTKLAEALGRMSMGLGYQYTNSIEMSVLYDIIANARDFGNFKNSMFVDKYLLDNRSKRLLQKSIPLRRVLCQEY